MSNIQVALPEPLVRRASALGISEQGLEGLTILLVQTYLDARGATPDQTAASYLDGATFARQVVAANRALFEELAQR